MRLPFNGAARLARWLGLCVCLGGAWVLLKPNALHSTAHAQGAAYRSLWINGTTGYVSVPSSSSIDLTGPFTLEAWFKTNSTSDDQIIAERVGRTGFNGGYAFLLRAGQIHFRSFKNGSEMDELVSATTVTTGQWYHVAGVFDGSQMRLYLNGTLDASKSSTFAPSTGTDNLYLGYSGQYACFSFNGRIDEVRLSQGAIYTSDFTAPEHISATGDTRGLWKFDGETANDSSSNHNDGTLFGSAQYSDDVPGGGGSPPNNPPTVSLTDPLNNTTFSAGSNIVIDATASDSDGSVSKVEFFQGTTLLGQDLTAPYSFSWANVPTGNYSLTARATDNQGATTTSSAVNISVTPAGNYHSLSLNGINGYVTVPNSASINLTGPFTLEAWFKTNSITDDQIIVERVGRMDFDGGYAFLLRAGQIHFRSFKNGSEMDELVSATTVTTGQWYHVAGVFDGNQMRLYLNGTLDASKSSTFAPASGTKNLFIGVSGEYACFPFNGLIDEVRLSEGALYTSNFTPDTHPAVGAQTRALWTFDDQTANDSTTNHNDGTLTDGAGFATDVPGGQGPPGFPVAVPGGPYSGAVGQSVQFNGSGSYAFAPCSPITVYHWNFGDSTTAGTANPAHSYAAAGTYTATLTVTDTCSHLASATTTVTIGGAARLDPLNRTGVPGEDPLSRNFNWSIPLVSLPGRAGLDLGLSLAYNSLATWTRQGTSISFDDDRGFPGPGFRLGFPVIQPPFYNSQTGKYSYLLITPAGSRVELRQVGNSNLYQASDSSYLLLDASSMALRSTDGTQLSYAWTGSDYVCTKIEDRNGNYLTINYDTLDRIDTVVDTLSRTVTFNYDTNGLSQITQTWAGQTHYWARFTYASKTIQTNFTGLTVNGPQNGTTIHALTEVKLADDSRFDFEYTSWGQVWKISQYTGETNAHLLNYRSYDLPADNSTAQTDCPRFTVRHDWAENWNRDTNGTAQEVNTFFDAPIDTALPDNSLQTVSMAKVKAPDDTYQQIYFAGSVSGSAGSAPPWERGLPLLTDTYDSNNTRQRSVTTAWTQDNTNVSYPLNPRVTETNISDPAGNHARTRTEYVAFGLSDWTTINLPQDTYEYQTDGTVLRRTHVDYNMTAAYTSRRIIGLPSAKYLCDGAQGEVPCNDASGASLFSKVTLQYDEAGSIQGSDAPVQHDNTNFGAGFVAGRANLSSVRRYDVTNSSQFTISSVQYNTAGAVVATHDPLNHGVTISYADQFAANGTSLDSPRSFATLAYPTSVTDADGYISSSRYHYDFGAVTWKQTPLPNVTDNEPGPQQVLAYDSIGRLERVTNLFNDAYTRYEYPASQNRVDTYGTIQDNAGEAHSFKVTDGHGRVIATARDHPGSVGGFSGQWIVYDNMGRRVKQSNPTETSASSTSGSPYNWPAAGDDAQSGWLYTQQTYDWKGRPLVTTNPSTTGNPNDATTKFASYDGCGCAGGEVVTLTDEVGRRQKVYSDVLGRQWKTELLNWNGTVYSTATNTFNARDQITLARQYQGAEASGVYQDTTMSYDGYGRLQSKHLPEQDPSTATAYAYNADDTIHSAADARGVLTTFGYNARRLLTSITYPDAQSLPPGVAPAANVTFGYDAAGNRTSMSDGFGSKSCSYNQLSQLTSETRYFSALGQSFTLSYDYNLGGELKRITDSTNMTINYGFDSTGRLTSVTGSDNLYGGVSNYASNFQYRAWGGLKAMTDGKGYSSSMTYNSKLQPNHFEISGGTVSQNYDYYADGHISFVHNTTDANFDRSYSYDYLGRLIEAKSGGQARNDYGDIPYYESFGYDAFNNLTARRSDSWNSQTSASDSASYTNNRHSGWGYDADGRNTTLGSRSNTFDAAGRQTQMTAQQVLSNGNHISVSQSSGYDGDGATVSETFSGVTTYHLRSTALGGQIVEELNGSGQKTVGYVSLPGGQLLATQISNPSQSVIWKHNTPAGTGEYTIYTYNTAIGRTEFDPLGADISLTQPPDPPPAEGAGDIGAGHVGSIMDQRWTDFFNLDSGIVINGSSVGSSEAMFYLNFGTGSRSIDNLGTTGEDVANAVLMSLGPAAFAPAGVSVVRINVSGVEGIPGHQTIEWQWVKYDGAWTFAPIPTAYSGTASMPGSFLMLGASVQMQQPQNPTPLSQSETDHLREDLQNLLNNKKCSDLVQAILNKLGANTGVIPYSTNLMDVFNKINKFEYKAGPYEAALGGNAGMVDAGLIKGGLTLSVNYRSLDFPQSRISSGEVLIHETTHAAPGSGMNSYLHYQMDQAAWDVARDMGLTPIGTRLAFTPTAQQGDTATSPFFNNMIYHFCGNGVKR